MSDSRNPLIQSTGPADTLNYASAVLYFLSIIEHSHNITEKESFGLSLILDTVQDALDYESDRVIPRPEEVES